MIASQDRSGWFGASDTAMICGNWKTATFKKWWLQKLGLSTDHFTSRAMNAGTYYEHAILDAIGAPRKDHQILLPDLSLRVNLDGDKPGAANCPGRIWEVKTHKAEKLYKLTKAHTQQVRVQMYAKMRVERCLPVACVVSYGLVEEDYRNFFNEIDPDRIRKHWVTYDPAFIDGYLKRLRYLQACLVKGVFPDEVPD